MVSSLQEDGTSCLNSYVQFFKTDDFFDKNAHKDDADLLQAHTDYLDYMGDQTKHILRHWKSAFKKNNKKPHLTFDDHVSAITAFFNKMAKEITEFVEKNSEYLTEPEISKSKDVYTYYADHVDWLEFLQQRNNYDSDYLSDSSIDSEESSVSARISRLLLG